MAGYKWMAGYKCDGCLTEMLPPPTKIVVTRSKCLRFCTKCAKVVELAWPPEETRPKRKRRA